MKYKLIVQWPASSRADYERLIATEELLEEGLSENDGEVGGHDMGSGEMNIFISTDFPERAFDQIRQIFVGKHLLETARVAYRERLGEEYVTLWPKGLKSFKLV